MKSRGRSLSLPFALPPSIKSAQISVLPEFYGAEPIARGSWNRLEAFQPSVLIGYAYDLTRLADAVEKGDILLTTVDRAIYALTDVGTPVIDDALRHKLWRVFGVPVYEIIVAPGCMLLAGECELHNGWHLQPGIEAHCIENEIVYETGRIAQAYTGYTGTIDSSRCECGRNTPALKGLHPLIRHRQARPPALPLAS
ncbi:MAG TPA: hypothetical protein VKX25_01580 [Bryobacteraceae bacterium]|jgi:hypothetical protein|nr:hypothetical protein [Bryobacteraceae bacterium]